MFKHGYWVVSTVFKLWPENHFSTETELEKENYYLTSCLQIFLFTLCSALPFL